MGSGGNDIEIMMVEIQDKGGKRGVGYTGYRE